MSSKGYPGAAQLYGELVRRAEADENVLGLILAGSRGTGIFVTERSDFDTYVVLRSPESDWGAGHGEAVEVWPMTIDEFRQHALVGAPDPWNRPTFLYARVEIDKPDGEIHRLVEEKRRMTPGEVDRIVPETLDGYINSLYRSLKNLEAGRALPTVHADAIERIAREATPRDQRAVFRDVEYRAREAGFGSIVDGWEPDVEWLLGGRAGG